jgi:class 3 adenylate cyclase
MSAVVCFDIRNFSMHVAHLLAYGEADRIFKLVEKIFACLDDAINACYEKIGVKDKTYVNHTGDGFVAIFYGKSKCLQGLLVASLVATGVKNLFDEYNEATKDMPMHLDYGIGVHRGLIKKFNYHSEYPTSKLVGVGFLGHVINIASRVQESTKDHTFNLICTKPVYDEVISIISEKESKTIDECFFPLGRHKLPGIKRTYMLYGVRKYKVSASFPKKLKTES